MNHAKEILSIFTRKLLSIIILSIMVLSLHTIHAAQPAVIKLDMPAPADSAGGIIAADVDDDGAVDLLVTVPGHIGAYSNDGKKLWIIKADLVVGSSSESVGLPGHNGPGVAAGDVNADGKTEVVFLTKDRKLHIVEGASGKEIIELAEQITLSVKNLFSWRL